MRILLGVTLLRLTPGARKIVERQVRVREGMLMFLAQTREELAEQRLLCSDRNLYLMELEEPIRGQLAHMKWMFHLTWGSK